MVLLLSEVYELQQDASFLVTTGTYSKSKTFLSLLDNLSERAATCIILFDYPQHSATLAMVGVTVRVMDVFSQTSSLTLADCLSENIHNTLSWRN